MTQLEHAVRVLLKAHDVYTLAVDSETGVESEKTSGVLLDMPETAQIFGDGIVLELKTLLLKQAGPNLRNDAAHGLLGGADVWSYTSAYVWWMCLRLVLTPLIVTQGDIAQS